MLTLDTTDAARARIRTATGAVAATMATGTLASLVTPAAAEDTVTVQGEAPATTSFTPGVTALAEASGGAALLTTNGAPASGRYTAAYQIDVPADGYYTVDATTIKKNVDWASPGQYSVDGGDLQPHAGAPEVAGVSGLLSTYRLGTFALAAGTVKKITWVIDGTSKTRNVDTAVAAGQTVTFTSPEVRGTGGPVDYAATVTFADGVSASYSGVVARHKAKGVVTLPEATVSVDGALDALPGISSHAPTGLGVDPANLSGTTWVTWDQDNLYVSALVHDDTFSQPFVATQTGRGDALQFAIATMWPGEASARPDLQTGYEYALALTQRGVELYQWRGAAAGLVTYPAAVTRDDAAGTTTYEVAIPWSQLGGIDPTAGTVAAVSVAVDDTDDGDHRGWASWGDGILTQKNTALYVPALFSSSVAGGN